MNSRNLKHLILVAGVAVGLAATAIATSAAAQGLNPNRAPTPPPRSVPAPQKKPAESAIQANAVGTSATTAPSATQQVLDQIVAVVNGEIITKNELKERVDSVNKALSRQGTQLPPSDVLERQVLERMIVEKAQVQLAVENGIRVDDVQLDRAVQRVAESNSLSMQAFRDRVEKEGTPYARFRDELRNQILMERVRGKEVDEKIQVGEGEVDAFIAEQTGGGSSGSASASSEVDVAQILVRVPEQATPEQVERLRAKAEDLYTQASGGADFGRLAASFSDAPEALQGGDLGFRSLDRLPQLFIDAVAPLSAGQVAKPVKSGNGFHILKLVAKRGAGAGATAGAGSSLTAPVEQTHARHILIRVNEVVSDEQARTRLEDIRQRIQNKTASFDDMARAYSNDASSSRGGDLGTLYPGDTVPEFEKAMNDLKPGEISTPVRTPFGYHLIEVVDRKKQDVAQDRVRLLARQAIRERKIDEAAESWLRELRDRAYVEMRLDDK